MDLDSPILGLILKIPKMDNAIFNKAWELVGQNNCFLCGKSLDEHIQDTGKRFDMYCRTEYHHLMESWNWKTVCRDCLPVIEKIESQVLD
jgi:hypothetical protein